ncbi:helix-turn-helix domain-containing protein [Oerskovia sp. Sa4CUA1]|uniref:Helix-turn-helix domain-containing protein n=2 Tax=Oerskovia rustica TaxID=2762237 RepID=A0ABR8RUA9_9CELL|nr:helix-turn-helix domain-containing protein [Oerskovia rustica]
MLIVERRRDGWKQAHIAAAMGVSRKTVRHWLHWLHRFATEAETGLADRSSRPRHSPTRTSAETEARVMAQRWTTRPVGQLARLQCGSSAAR